MERAQRSRRKRRRPREGDDDGVAVNVKSILRRLFALQTHPDLVQTSRRVPGASTVPRGASHPAAADGSRRFGNFGDGASKSSTVRLDPPRAGAEEAGALLTRAAVRACARHALALSREPPAGTAPRGGTFADVAPLVAWTFAEGHRARSETRARLRVPARVRAHVQRRPEIHVTRGVRARRRSKNAAGWWPFEIHEPPPSRETLAARGAAAPPDERAASAAWFRALVAARAPGAMGARARTHHGRRPLAECRTRMRTRRYPRATSISISISISVPLGDVPATSERRGAAYVRDGLPPAPAASSSDGSDAISRRTTAHSRRRARLAWRRAQVKLAVQILVLGNASRV